MLKVCERYCKGLQEHGIEIKPSKFKLFQTEVCFLGRIGSAESYKIDPKSTAAVEAMKDSNPLNF